MLGFLQRWAARRAATSAAVAHLGVNALVWPSVDTLAQPYFMPYLWRQLIWRQLIWRQLIWR
jgi:hypothetical protein